jgi:hypothetical protein
VIENLTMADKIICGPKEATTNPTSQRRPVTAAAIIADIGMTTVWRRPGKM